MAVNDVTNSSPPIQFDMNQKVSETLHFAPNCFEDKSWARFAFSANLLKCLNVQMAVGARQKISKLTRRLT